VSSVVRERDSVSTVTDVESVSDATSNEVVAITPSARDVGTPVLTDLSTILSIELLVDGV